MLRTIMQWCNIKPKSVKFAEALFTLVPEEEWKRINTPNEDNLPKDIQKLILILAKDATCVYSIKRSLSEVSLILADAKYESPRAARNLILSFIRDELFK